MDGIVKRNPALDGLQQLHSGTMIDLFAPNIRHIFIEDIAHALSNTCRYAGHVKSFYSVAQHSVLVSNICAAEGRSFAMAGLLHDAHEAYIGDIPSPVVASFGPDARRRINDAKRRLDSVIFSRFRIKIGPLSEEVIKRADMIVLATEKRDILQHPDIDWGPLPDPLPDQIAPLDPIYARGMFIDRFWELAKEMDGNVVPFVQVGL